jgi:hypothetical protein
MERDQITRTQLVEIIEELVFPYIGGKEPQHFERVNNMIHALLAVRGVNDEPYTNEDEMELAQGRDYDRWARVHHGRSMNE